jgi:hypothetical protein
MSYSAKRTIVNPMVLFTECFIIYVVSVASEKFDFLEVQLFEVPV